MLPALWVDFNTQMAEGMALDGRRTIREAAGLGVTLEEGMHIILYEEDISDEGQDSYMHVEAIVRRDHAHNRWIADPAGFEYKWTVKAQFREKHRITPTA